MSISIVLLIPEESTVVEPAVTPAPTPVVETASAPAPAAPVEDKKDDDEIKDLLAGLDL